MKMVYTFYVELDTAVNMFVPINNSIGETYLTFMSRSTLVRLGEINSVEILVQSDDEEWSQDLF